MKNRLARISGRTQLHLKANSPHILFGVGVVGVIASTVLACRATLKADKVLDEIKKDIEEVKGPDEEESKTVTRSDVAYVYVKSAARVAKVYSPALVVGSASIACLAGAHVQLTRRNMALTAAYSALHTAFMEYRERVRSHVGVDTERELYYDIKTERTTDEKGKAISVKSVDPTKWSPYARFFDQGSPNWHKDAERNRIFVQVQQTYFNQLLQVRGHVFLNEVYDALGIDRSRAGQVVGWIMNGNGDNYIDFGIFDPQSIQFINGIEPVILLDFNVDGVVIDKL
jgi:Family of unknown function (DUF6353)